MVVPELPEGATADRCAVGAAVAEAGGPASGQATHQCQQENQ